MAVHMLDYRRSVLLHSFHTDLVLATKGKNNSVQDWIQILSHSKS